jgi:hypothetical protein
VALGAVEGCDSGAGGVYGCSLGVVEAVPEGVFWLGIFRVVDVGVPVVRGAEDAGVEVQLGAQFGCCVVHRADHSWEGRIGALPTFMM